MAVYPALFTGDTQAHLTLLVVQDLVVIRDNSSKEAFLEEPLNLVISCCQSNLVNKERL